MSFVQQPNEVQGLATAVLADVRDNKVERNPTKVELPTPGEWQGAMSVGRPVRILIIDDEPINVKICCKYLQEMGYSNVEGIMDGRKALQKMITDTPDIVITDLMMPGYSGLDLIKDMRGYPSLVHVPIIVLTAAGDRETRIAVLESGATDFLSKPIDPCELEPRLRNVVMLKSYRDFLSEYAQNLEAAVEERTRELEASRQDVILCLARAAEFRDDDTGHHVVRVGKYASIIAEELGWSAKDVKLLEQAAQLHDVGKIGIPDSILLKPGKLSADEIDRMRTHAGSGKHILEPFSDLDWETVKRHVWVGAKIMEIPSSPVLKMAAQVALTHHEKWDGTGYPLGLAGEDIPLCGRIVAVADVFDALSSKRPYKPAMPREKCFQIMEADRGTHFDPKVLDAFTARRAEITDLQIRYADSK